MGLTYRDSGVDIDKGDRFVEAIKRKLPPKDQGNIGLFGGLFDISALGYKNPVLVASTDGIGTKLLVAKEAGRFETIGIDLVAMCVNDLVPLGAKPLFFLDYLATAELDIDTASTVIDGILEGCAQAGCTLLGGETAEMPGVYRKGDYELAGFTVGIVERERIIDGKTIAKGDLLIGIRSSGIHSNGLSLARRALLPGKHLSPEKAADAKKIHPALGRSIYEELLVPTRIYVKSALEIIDGVRVKGIAHITGGGIYGNTKRLLPEGLDLAIDWNSWKPNPIFALIQETGGVEDAEMRKTFNLGIGLVFVVAPEEQERLNALLREKHEEPQRIGEVVSKKP
jgi:phosphoribosylformylglycinamidine cyclo-ligase